MCHVLIFIIQVPISWEEVNVTPVLKNGKTAIPDEALHSINKNKVALKGIKLLMTINTRLTFFFSPYVIIYHKTQFLLPTLLRSFSKKGPLETPVGKGHVSLNLTLRRYCYDY